MPEEIPDPCRSLVNELADMWEHRHVLAAIRDIDCRYAERPAVARWMGVALVIVGLVALVVIIIM
jgi:hypothetical protein